MSTTTVMPFALDFDEVFREERRVKALLRRNASYRAHSIKKQKQQRKRRLNTEQEDAGILPSPATGVLLECDPNVEQRKVLKTSENSNLPPIRSQLHPGQEKFVSSSTTQFPDNFDALRFNGKDIAGDGDAVSSREGLATFSNVRVDAMAHLKAVRLRGKRLRLHPRFHGKFNTTSNFYKQVKGRNGHYFMKRQFPSICDVALNNSTKNSQVNDALKRNMSMSISIPADMATFGRRYTEAAEDCKRHLGARLDSPDTKRSLGRNTAVVNPVDPRKTTDLKEVIFSKNRDRMIANLNYHDQHASAMYCKCCEDDTSGKNSPPFHPVPRERRISNHRPYTPRQLLDQRIIDISDEFSNLELSPSKGTNPNRITLYQSGMCETCGRWKKPANWVDVRLDSAASSRRTTVKPVSAASTTRFTIGSRRRKGSKAHGSDEDDDGGNISEGYSSSSDDEDVTAHATTEKESNAIVNKFTSIPSNENTYMQHFLPYKASEIPSSKNKLNKSKGLSMPKSGSEPNLTFWNQRMSRAFVYSYFKSIPLPGLCDDCGHLHYPTQHKKIIKKVTSKFKRF